LPQVTTSYTSISREIQNFYNGRDWRGDCWAIPLRGKVIGVTGTIELYKGKAEIKVLAMKQITGAASQPVAQ